MKNKLITLALILLSATVMASCHPPRDTYPDDPPYLESALKATFGINVSGITSVEFSEAGRYVVTFMGTEETPPDVLCGKYYIEDGLYVMEEFGTAEISKDTVRLNIRTWPYQDSFTLPADINYNCKRLEAKFPATTAICRTWTVEKTVINYPAGQQTTFEGFSLYEIANFLAEYGQPYFARNQYRLGGYTVDEITFTGQKTVLISYTREETLIAQYKQDPTEKCIVLTGLPDWEGDPYIRANCSFQERGKMKANITIQIQDENDVFTLTGTLHLREKTGPDDDAQPYPVY